MQHETAEILAAIQAGDTPAADFAHLKLPDSYRAVTVHADEAEMFAGLASRDKDPRRSLHVEDVAVPELGPGEAIVAVMASAINYNSVWTSIFEPVSTFSFLKRYGRVSELTRRHDLPYHVIGSDLSGVVLRTGPGVNKWKPGDEVVAHCLSVELEDAEGHDDTMLDPQQAFLVNRNKIGSMALAGESLFVLEMRPASYAILAANEAEKAARIKLVDYRMIGATGRLYLSGSEADVRQAAGAAEDALRNLA